MKSALWREVRKVGVEVEEGVVVEVVAGVGLEVVVGLGLGR